MVLNENGKVRIIKQNVLLYANPSDSCLDMSLKIKNVNLLEVGEKKLMDHQSQEKCC